MLSLANMLGLIVWSSALVLVWLWVGIPFLCGLYELTLKVNYSAVNDRAC
jgi:hypothetical protein